MSEAPAPKHSRYRNLVGLLPLVLAGWAIMERCATSPAFISPTLTSAPKAALPSSSLPRSSPGPTALDTVGAPPGAPCPIDTLPDRGLCLPVPPVVAAGPALPVPAAADGPQGSRAP
jgi:hypothetical protein